MKPITINTLSSTALRIALTSGLLSLVAACAGGGSNPPAGQSSSSLSSVSSQPASSLASSSSLAPLSSSSVNSSSALSSSSVVASSSSSSMTSSSVVISSSSSSMTSSSLSISSSSTISSSSSTVSSTGGGAGNGMNILGSDGTFSASQGMFGGNNAFTWNGQVNVVIPAVTTNAWDVQLTHGVPIMQGQPYILCYRARADASRMIQINIDDAGTPSFASVISSGSLDVLLTSQFQLFEHTFTGLLNDTSSRLTMNLGAVDPTDVANVQIDDIGLYLGGTCGDPSNIAAGPVGSGTSNIVGTPPITTQGNQVLFGGQEGSIAGMSLFWSNFSDGSRFYTQGVVETLANDWGSKLIRASMGIEEAGGYVANPNDNLSRVQTVVNEAIANDMYVIIDWHTHNAEDVNPNLAITFFRQMAQNYGASNNVIYEVYNEPDCPAGVTGTACNFNTKTTWAEIKAYALPVINAIREIDPDNLIIVGTPFYSQFVDDASENPIVAADFPGNGSYANNIAYTLHFYAGTHKQQERARAVTALRNGIPLFVTEWGTVGASGDGAVDVAESDIWMQFLFDNNISHANWSITDKAEGSALLSPGSNATNGWDDSDLTESGRYVRDQIINW